MTLEKDSRPPERKNQGRGFVEPKWCCFVNLAPYHTRMLFWYAFVCVWCLFGTHFFAHPHSLSSIARIRVLVILWFVLCCLCTSLVCFSFPLPFLSLLPRKNGVLLSFPFFSFFFSAIGNGGWGEVWEKREKAFLFFFEEQKKREEIGEKKRENKQNTKEIVLHLDNCRPVNKKNLLKLTLLCRFCASNVQSIINEKH
jgi:hypothetical protein